MINNIFNDVPCLVNSDGISLYMFLIKNIVLKMNAIKTIIQSNKSDGMTHNIYIIYCILISHVNIFIYIYKYLTHAGTNGANE